MTHRSKGRGLTKLAREEMTYLLKVTPSDRIWQLPVAAALSTGVPLLAGSYFGRLDLALIGSLAGLVILYLPNTSLPHRMSRLMSCAFAMTACYTLGLISHHFPPLMMPVLIAITILMTMLCRFFEVGPPGSLFFVMSAAIGAYSPFKPEMIPTAVGVFSMGSISACLIALIYSLFTLRLKPPESHIRRNPITFDFLFFDPVIIGVFTGLSLAIAQLLHLQKAYWVPISCLVVIQGTSLRAVWTRKVHRLFGTSVGLVLAWAFLKLPFDPWTISIMIMVLSFIVESIVVRHYAIAAIFITPLALLLAEAATLGHGSAELLIRTRFLDTLLGCFVGFAGGVCLHSSSFRKAVGGPLKKLMQQNLPR